MARTVELELELVGVHPRIWRRLRLPADASLRDLHHAIQLLFSWEDRHLHVFDVGRHDAGLALTKSGSASSGPAMTRG